MNVLCLSDGFDEEDQSHLLIIYKKCCLLSIYLFYIEIIKTNPSDNKINPQPFFHLDHMRILFFFLGKTLDLYMRQRLQTKKCLE